MTKGKGKTSDHLLGYSWKGHNFVKDADEQKKKKPKKKIQYPPPKKKPKKKIQYPPPKKKRDY